MSSNPEDLQSPLPPASSEDANRLQEIAVTLLLEGGHQYMLHLPPDAPLLVQLFEMIVHASQSQRLLQVPVNDGSALLCLAGNRLIGLLTEPPVVMQQFESQVAPR